MPRRNVLALTVALLAFSMPAGFASSGSRGPFTPVIARQKLSYIAVDLQGNQKVISEFIGEYLRSSDGSELATLGLPVGGSAALPGTIPTVLPQEGRLRLGRDGTTYKLDYKKRVATVVARQQLPILPHSYQNVKKEDILGHERVEGRNCLQLPVVTHGDQTGTAWRETKTDILMRLVSFFGSQEDQVRVVLERFDVSTKQEPDESFFAVPNQWTIIWPKELEPALSDPVSGGQPSSAPTVPKPTPQK